MGSSDDMSKREGLVAVLVEGTSEQAGDITTEVYSTRH